MAETPKNDPQDFLNSDPTIKRDNLPDGSSPPAADYTMAKFGEASPAEIPADKTTLYSQKAGSSGFNQKSGLRTQELPPEAKTAAADPKNVMNQYILVKQVGKGGMGTVWRAFDRSLMRWAAIKFLISEGNDEGVQRFQREAQLSASLHHPNIASVFEVGEFRGQHFLAMDFIDGQSLSAVDLQIAETLDIFIKVAQGVEAAHKKGIIHRDLKPQNVMLTEEKWPYVMDFGLAKALSGDSSLSVTGAIMGTPAYMPPEQASGKTAEIDAQTDIYSLGATLYAVLTRKPPFSADNAMDILMKVCTEEPPMPRTLNPEIPKDVETIIMKAMSKRKEDRYLTANEMAEDIKRYLSSEEIQATRPSSLKMAIRRIRRNSSAVAVGISLIIAAGAIAFVATRSKPGPEPGVTNPEEAAEREREKKRIAWRTTWGEIQDKLDFKGWKAGDSVLPEKANLHLKGMAAADIPRLDMQAIVRWNRQQLSDADRELTEIHNAPDAWKGQRDRVGKIADYVEAMAAATQGIDDIKNNNELIDPIRTKALAILNFKGTFALRIAVGPYAKIVSMTCDGKEIKLSERFTPVYVKNLPVGDTVIRLEHPALGQYEVKVPASKIQDGKAYGLTGLMKDQPDQLVELP